VVFHGVRDTFDNCIRKDCILGIGIPLSQHTHRGCYSSGTRVYRGCYNGSLKVLRECYVVTRVLQDYLQQLCEERFYPGHRNPLITTHKNLDGLTAVLQGWYMHVTITFSNCMRKDCILGIGMPLLPQASRCIYMLQRCYKDVTNILQERYDVVMMVL
jgi:hypothetical protein